MLVESAIENIAGSIDGSEPDTIDWLDLTWIECRNRFGRKYTRGQKEVRLLLRLQQTLDHGDLLGHWSDGQRVVVNLLPTELLVIRPKNVFDSINAAFQLGNLHAPMELTTDSFLTPHTSEAEAMLIKFQIPFELDQRRFKPSHWPDAVKLSQSFQIIRRSRPIDRG